MAGAGGKAGPGGGSKPGAAATPPAVSVPDADRAIGSGIYDKVYSAAACIASRGDQLFHRAVYGTPVQPPPHAKIGFDAVFDLASLTKVLGSGLICLQLASLGRLDLSSPVNRVLKDFKSPHWSQIRLEHLLDHTSGLVAFKPFYEELRQRQEAGEADLLGSAAGKAAIRALLADEQPEAALGTRALYSDLNFMILGLVLEEVTGLPLDVYLQRELLKPLGIEDLFYVDLTRPPDKLGPRRTFVATERCPWRDKLLQGEVHDPNAWAMGGVAGHAGLFGTVDAVWRLARALLASYEGDNRVFHGGTVRRFWTRSKRVRETTHGLAWDTPSASGSQAGRRISLQAAGHLGFTGTSLWIDYTKRVIVVFLANAVHPSAEGKKEKMREIRPRVHDQLFKAADILPPEGQATARGASAFGAAAGGGSAAFGNPLRKPGMS